MKIKRMLLIIAVFLLLGQITAPMSAYSVPEKPEDFTIYDDTGVISDFTREYLVALNDLLYQKCSSKTVIALFDGIGGEDIKEFANKCFNEWGIGDLRKGNGTLLVINTAENDCYAIIGSELKDDFIFGELNYIIYIYVKPYLKAQDYKGAVKVFAEVIYKKLAGIYGFSDMLPETGAFSGKTVLLETGTEKTPYKSKLEIEYTFADRVSYFSKVFFSVLGTVFSVIAIVIVIKFLSFCFCDGSCCGSCSDIELNWLGFYWWDQGGRGKNGGTKKISIGGSVEGGASFVVRRRRASSAKSGRK